ncbi:hypothetical protein WEU_02793 [Citrobacter sp. KTE32]|nr:hypothetical protein WEU_02793 [Citrobacter sp. KTE32]
MRGSTQFKQSKEFNSCITGDFSDAPDDPVRIN